MHYFLRSPASAQERLTASTPTLPPTKCSLALAATALDCGCQSPPRRSCIFPGGNVVRFQPGGMASTREWIQIDRADAADYEKDLPLFQASVEFVKAGPTR